MAISKVQIANMALSQLGAGRIESFGENSTEAQEVSTWYDFARQQALEAYTWKFARKRLTLATASDDPPTGIWSYRYQYPSDCLHAREIENSDYPDNAIPFDVETNLANEVKTILTDRDDAVLIYTFDCELPSLYSPHFVVTLSNLLAFYMAFALTGKESLVDKKFEHYRAMVLLASIADKNEGVPKPPREAPWIRGR